jgi:hypothetical protein
MAGSRAASEGSREVQKESTQKTTVTVREETATRHKRTPATERTKRPPPPPPPHPHPPKKQKSSTYPLFKREIGVIWGKVAKGQRVFKTLSF